MSDDDKILQFPGTKQPEPVLIRPNAREDGTLTEAQQKAIHCLLSGMTFVFVGVQPTDSGCDFFTACDGDKDALRNAEDHLPGTISKLFVRCGVR